MSPVDAAPHAVARFAAHAAGGLLRYPRTWAALVSAVLHVGAAALLMETSLVGAPVVEMPAETVRTRIDVLPPAAPPQPVAPQSAARPVPEGAAPAGRRAASAGEAAAPRFAVVNAANRAVPATESPWPSPDGAARTDPAAGAGSASGRNMAEGAQAAAPPSASLPPAPAAGTSDPDWAGRVLARLEKFRVYPDGARNRREQGVAVVRVRLDHRGRVLALELVSGTGHATLDAEALATFRRAEPLPPPPASLPDPVQLEVPVEFFVR